MWQVRAGAKNVAVRDPSPVNSGISHAFKQINERRKTVVVFIIMILLVVH